MKKLVTFTSEGKREKKTNNRVKNVLKLYIWNEVEHLELDARGASVMLGVTTRTAYRYLKIIDEVKGDV